jgi:uncharacterized repeat protein (TIGR03803 family)
MRSKKLSLGLAAVLAMFVVATLMTATLAAAQTEKVLYNFEDEGPHGSGPQASLIFDSAGNLYGTTWAGGVHNLGTVFELSPNGSGGYTEKMLHSFGSGKDGELPAAGLIMDASGNLYGTTVDGGAYGGIGKNGGIVFELSPNGTGGWTYKTLHNFGNGTDGQFVQSGLVMDGSGNLFGTTSYGGIYGAEFSGGTVYELKRTTGGTYAEKILHSFGNGSDGQSPTGGVILDSAGNLYGTTEVGGGSGAYGTVFELKPAGSNWVETTLYNFNTAAGVDGAYPYANLVFDSAGNLFGTTFEGGATNEGTVFELSPSGGSWTETVIHSFVNNGTDGYHTFSALVFDGSGNFYGTTNGGGTFTYGTLFEFSPAGGGAWTESILHSFGGTNDGILPYAGVVLDSSGNLYGTTRSGGRSGGGIVFEVIP